MKNLYISLFSTLTILLQVSMIDANFPSPAYWDKPLSVCWKQPLENISGEGIASDNETLVAIPVAKSELFGIDSETGAQLWLKDSSEMVSDLLLDRESILVVKQPQDNTEVPNSQLVIQKFDLASGLDLVIDRYKSYGRMDSIVRLASNLVLLSNRDGKLSLVDLAHKSIPAEFDLGVEFSTKPVAHQTKYYVGTTNNTVIVGTIGNLRIESQLPIGFIPSALALSENTLFVGDERGSINAFAQKDVAKRWETTLGGKIIEVKVLSQGLLASSNDNYVYLLDVRTGKKLWKRKLSGRIFKSAMLDNRFAGFVSNGSNEFVIIDLENGKIINRAYIDSKDYFVEAPLKVSKHVILFAKSGLYSLSFDCKS